MTDKRNKPNQTRDDRRWIMFKDQEAKNPVLYARIRFIVGIAAVVATIWWGYTEIV